MLSGPLAHAIHGPVFFHIQTLIGLHVFISEKLWGCVPLIYSLSRIMFSMYYVNKYYINKCLLNE